MNLPTIDEELAFLAKHRVTPNELTLIQTLLVLTDEDNCQPFQSYLEGLHACGISLDTLLRTLREKGVLHQGYKIPEAGQPFDPYTVPFNQNFLKEMHKSAFSMGKELFDRYPMFGSIQGKMVGLRAISRKFDSLEDAFRNYGKAIRWNPETHKRILDLIEWANEHNIINYTLASFIVDHRWEELKALKDGQGNIDYDSVTLL